MFYFRSLLKVAKKQIPGIFITRYVYIVLDKKFIELFGNDHVANDMRYTKNLT